MYSYSATVDDIPVFSLEILLLLNVLKDSLPFLETGGTCRWVGREGGRVGGWEGGVRDEERKGGTQEEMEIREK